MSTFERDDQLELIITLRTSSPQQWSDYLASIGADERHRITAYAAARDEAGAARERYYEGLREESERTGNARLR